MRNKRARSLFFITITPDTRTLSITKNQEKSVLQNEHTVGHLKINIPRKYILLSFFSEKCRKSML